MSYVLISSNFLLYNSSIWYIVVQDQLCFISNQEIIPDTVKYKWLEFAWNDLCLIAKGTLKISNPLVSLSTGVAGPLGARTSASTCIVITNFGIPCIYWSSLRSETETVQIQIVECMGEIWSAGRWLIWHRQVSGPPHHWAFILFYVLLVAM